jgi:hypothetical protein
MYVECLIVAIFLVIFNNSDELHMTCKFDHNVFEVFTTINNVLMIKLCHS